MLGLAMHSLADLGDVREDGLLVAFAMHGGRDDGVALSACARELGILRVEGLHYAAEELERIKGEIEPLDVSRLSEK